MASPATATPPSTRATLQISNGGWGGDLVLSSRGELQLSRDLPGNPQATMERIARIINTTPRQLDKYGNPVASGDDPFHQEFAAGLPAHVDELSSDQLVTFIQRRILSALVRDPLIAPTPAPSVVVTVVSPDTVSVAIRCATQAGQPVVMTGANALTLSVPATAGG